jgi:hypothetical protein
VENFSSQKPRTKDGILFLLSAYYSAFQYDFPQCVQTSLYAYVDAKIQTSDPQLERDRIPKVKADQQRLDANNRRKRLRRSIYFGSETEQQREIRLKNKKNGLGKIVP